jgi:Flp pilus assembly pilin Flp
MKAIFFLNHMRVIGCNGLGGQQMRQLLFNLWREEDGQDLIEYSLLITFIAIATAAVVGSGQNAIRSIWTTSNSQIQAANSAS